MSGTWRRLLILILPDIIVFARCEEFNIFFFSAFCFKLPWYRCGGPKHIIFYKASGQLLPSISIIFLITIDFSQILCEPNYVGSAITMLPFPSSCVQLYCPLAPGNAHKCEGTSAASVQKSTSWNPCFRKIRLRELGYWTCLYILTNVFILVSCCHLLFTYLNFTSLDWKEKSMKIYENLSL